MITSVKVYYETDEKAVMDLYFETRLAKFLEKEGLRRYASGYDLKTHVRDIAFNPSGKGVKHE